MSTIDRSKESPAAEPVQAPAPPIYLNARAEFASRFLFGEGLEIGPLHQPLALPPQARARYVDRMKIDELRREYPELAGWNLTEVDVVDDGELLTTVAEESQDFIVANHFLEHCENPINTIKTHLGKLKPGGILFYAVPDKRYTFDYRRPVTPLEHMEADFDEGPARSRSEHYEEWSRFVIDEESPAVGSAEQADSEQWVAAKARELEEAKYSIHMHVWTQAEFLKLILNCRERFDDGFDLEASARQAIEFMVVLRKSGSFPEPPPAAQAVPPAALGGSGRAAELDRWKARAKRVVAKLRSEAQRRRTGP